MLKRFLVAPLFLVFGCSFESGKDSRLSSDRQLQSDYTTVLAKCGFDLYKAQRIALEDGSYRIQFEVEAAQQVCKDKKSYEPYIPLERLELKTFPLIAGSSWGDRGELLHISLSSGDSVKIACTDYITRSGGHELFPIEAIIEDIVRGPNGQTYILLTGEENALSKKQCFNRYLIPYDPDNDPEERVTGLYFFE